MNVRLGENCVRKVLTLASEYDGVVTFTEVEASMDMTCPRSGPRQLVEVVNFGRVF